DRPAIAALAPLVLDAANGGGNAAGGIVGEGGHKIAAALSPNAKQPGLSSPPSFALGRGPLFEIARLLRWALRSLALLGIHPAPVTLVPEPAEGAVRLAAARLPHAK